MKLLVILLINTVVSSVAGHLLLSWADKTKCTRNVFVKNDGGAMQVFSRCDLPKGEVPPCRTFDMENNIPIKSSCDLPDSQRNTQQLRDYYEIERLVFDADRQVFSLYKLTEQQAAKFDADYDPSKVKDCVSLKAVPRDEMCLFKKP